MEDPKEESIQGRGEDELLPSRGNPFAFQEEDGQESNNRKQDSNESVPSKDLNSKDDPRAWWESPPETASLSEEDHGLRAVGPPLPEDLMAEGVPLPSVGPEVPIPGLPKEERPPHYSTLYDGPPKELEPEPSQPDADERFVPSDQAGVADGAQTIPDQLARIEQLRSRAREEIRDPSKAKLLLEEIEQVRGELIESQNQIGKAGLLLDAIENRLDSAAQASPWLGGLPWILILYELVMLVLMISGMIYLPGAIADITQRYLGVEIISADISLPILILTCLWGGVGGGIAALVNLRAQLAFSQDLDRHGAVWYLTNPFIGMVMGALIFLLTRAGRLILFPGAQADIPFPAIIYFVAWIAGFQQHFAYDVAERVTKLFERRS